MDRSKRLGEILLSLIFIMVLCLIPSNVKAADGDITISAENFPDEGFRSYLKTYFGSDIITQEMINNTDKLEIDGGTILSFNGIDKFIKLDRIYYTNGLASSIEISGSPTLKDLYLSDWTNLKSIKVSNCPLLETIGCGSNNSKSLSIKGCPSLWRVQCQFNQLTTLDIDEQSCASLLYLDCFHNQLTYLNVSYCKALKNLACYNNQLTSLDLSKNTNLEILRAFNNKLTSLDVSSCTKLTDLELGNPITRLKLGRHNGLKRLHAIGDKMTELDISKCPLICAYVNAYLNGKEWNYEFLYNRKKTKLIYDKGVIPGLDDKEKSKNTITADDIIRKFSPKKQSFNIKATALGGAKLSYKSSNSKISISKSGKITVKAGYVGKATITITAAETEQYSKTTVKIKVRVNPGEPSNISVTNSGDGKITVKWKKSASTKATGYQIQYSTSARFTKKTTKTVNVKGVKKVSKIIPKLKKGKKYYVRIRTYLKYGVDTYYSPWVSKTVAVKK